MVDLALLTWTFLWLSLLCVGGGLGVIPEMERQAVTIHGWLTAREFVDGYTLTQLTPGPNMLIAVFVGYRAHGALGALLAGLAMFLPTSVLAMVVSHHWQEWRTRPWAALAERALIPVGVGLMAGGVYTLARTAIHDAVTLALAVLTALVVATDRVPPVLAVVAAGALGWLFLSR
jgi:chromate transporter